MISFRILFRHSREKHTSLYSEANVFEIVLATLKEHRVYVLDHIRVCCAMTSKEALFFLGLSATCDVYMFSSVLYGGENINVSYI